MNPARFIRGDAALALRQRFDEVIALRRYDPLDVPAGRRYVEAYVEYMHFAERLHELLTGEEQDHWGAHHLRQPG